MLQKILILVVLSIGAVVSIVDPKYFEKSQPYRRDPYIAQELQRHQHRHTSSYRADYQPRLSPERYQQSENVEQQERHANYGRPGHDYANNIDEHYGGCPSGFTGQLPYPYDCRRFVNCWKGRAYIQTCGPGTVFNADTQECDHPTKVVCQGLSALSRRNAESTTHRLARVQTSASDEVSCPPGHTGLVAHPQDCSKFLNCANGVMHIQSCGPQTMFDPHMKVCNFEHQVDCSGRDGGSYSSPSPLPAPVSGYRGGKTFESNARDNQAVNQEVPQRKGWPHSHNHHGFQSGYPSRSPPPSGSFSHDEENCTEVNYNHRQMPSAQPAAQTPIIYRDRWATMNRTRPSPPAVPGRTWTTTTTTTTQKPSRWWPIPQTTSTPQPTWQSHGSSGSSWTTPRPSSNYPNINYGNTTPNRTTHTTTIYYAQPVDYDQPSEEVFSNVDGGDISEITLPSNRQNANRGVNFRPSHSSTDAISIPNMNLMPPHPSSPSDDRQSPIFDQYPDYSSSHPSFPASEQPGSFSYPSARGEDHWSTPVDNHPKMDAMDIPNRNLMPPHPSSPSDDTQSPIPEQYPDFSSSVPSYMTPQQPSPKPGSFNQIPARGESHWSTSVENYPKMDAMDIPNRNLMPPYPSSPSDDRQSPIPEQYPDFSSPVPSYEAPQKPSPGSFNQHTARGESHWSTSVENYPKMDAMDIPNRNLMPPYPSSPSDDRQSPIPEQYPDFSSSVPSYEAPQKPSPGSFNQHTARGESRWSTSVDNHPKMDAMDIPNRNLMPPYPSFSSDDRRSEPPSQYPNYASPYPSYVPPQQPSPRPGSFNRTTVFISPSPDGDHTTIDAINFPSNTPHRNPNWPSFSSPGPYPPFSLPQPNNHPGSSIFNNTIFTHTSTPAPDQQPIYDESNLFGGLLPPLSSGPEPSRPQSGRGFIHLLPPPQDPIPVPTSTTIPPPGVNTNVRTFQIYPPATIQNATTRLHASPFYSSPYAGVAHSRNAAWSSTGFDRTSPSGATPSPRHSTTTFVPEDNFEPEIIFSHDGGVVLPNRVISTTTERHGVSPPSYNREFYKQTTPFSVYNAPAETDTSDEVGQLPISEAIRLLLRPYFNRSGTMTDDMATNAESHIMSLSRSKEPTRTTSLRTTTTTSTATTTSTVAPPEIHKDVEIVFAGEQNSLTPGNTHPFHSHVHNHHQHHQHPPSKFHQHHHHDSDFHRRHPHLPNPFENELGEEDDSEHELTTPRAWEELKTTTEVVRNPAVDDVCQFDCGNGKCVKTFETCDGINNCGNRRDEEQCDHLGYDIRLSNENGGRVEVKILGQWGYVCDDKFGIQDANVVCRELGFPLGASEVRGNSYYPPTDGEGVSFVMDEVDCSGNETSLKDCPFMGWGVSDCGPDEVVGVQCKTPVMKCPNDYWLCSTSKECIPPAFVCDNVADCSDKSDESSAVCNSTVEFRLKGGKSKQEGRLEVLYRGAWGTVCDDDFGQTEAQVACNSLGYYGTAKIIKNAFGPGSGPIWLDQVSCFGNESTIDTCNHWSWGEHNCNHTEDVSLKCTAGSPPRQTNTGIKGEHKSTEEVQATTLDDIGMDIYPMERSSKFANTRKLCGHFNPNLTEELPREFERVVRGNLAKRGHHPWQATIRSKGRGGISSHWCGAVLISKKHLLTAAHCLVGYAKGAYFIRLGDHYANIAESSEIDSYIENWYIHEKFRDGTHMNNDIAVIVMKNPVRFNDYIQPICLPREGTEYEEGRQCTISGWGSIQSGLSTPSNNLRVAEIPIISDEVCKLPHVYGNSITEGMFCAGFLEEGVDACEGDSGGPFVCSDSGTETLYGIISWGQQCGYANKPGVYVKIEKYLDWIYEKIRFSMQQTN